MEYQEAKQKFLMTWGSLGTSWGINRTMAQVHALLLVATKPMSTDEIMEELKISRGNANMNIRSLMEWGLVEKELIPGERKEHFVAGKDIWELAKQIAEERKKRELAPVLKVLDQLKAVKGNTEDVNEFKKVTSDITEFAGQTESLLDIFINSKKNWFFKMIAKLKI